MKYAKSRFIVTDRFKPDHREKMSEVYVRGYAAGVLPFFDNGKTILLGKEYRKANDEYTWMEFGGKQELGEGLSYTAWREGNEETAFSLGLKLEQVEEAERNGHYVDYLNPKTQTFYRMYCVFLEEKVNLSVIQENAKDSHKVEKIEWKYFNTVDVIYNGYLPIPDGKIYSTAKIRYEMLKKKEFFKNLNIDI